MLCCIRRTKPVEKTEEADQEIKQDGTKPEDKAHKAATKIQASFRGHIIRKKMKDDDKEEESPAVAEPKSEENGEDNKKEKATSPVTENQNEVPKGNEKAKSPVTSPTGEENQVGAPTLSSSEPNHEAKEGCKEVECTQDEAAKSPENVDTEKKVEEKEEKGEAKQADVPAAAIEAADCEPETNQTQDKQDAAEDSKTAEGTISEEANEEDKEENA